MIGHDNQYFRITPRSSARSEWSEWKLRKKENIERSILGLLLYCPAGFAQTAKTRVGKLEAPAYREENFAVAEKNLNF